MTAAHRPAPPIGTPLADVDEWLADQGIRVADWPKPTPEQIERLRSLLGYSTAPLDAVGREARRAS